MEFLAGGRLTENDLAIIGATSRNHVVMRPGDRIDASTRVVMIDHCGRSDLIVFLGRLQVV